MQCHFQLLQEQKLLVGLKCLPRLHIYTLFARNLIFEQIRKPALETSEALVNRGAEVDRDVVLSGCESKWCVLVVVTTQPKQV